MTYKRKKNTRKSFYYYCRLLHIYSSTALFTLLMFFCLSGFFLNHLDSFGGQYTDEQIEIALTEFGVGFTQDELDSIAQGKGSKPLEQILAGLHGYGHLPKAKSVEADVEMGELIIDFDLPAGYATAVISVESQMLVLDYRQGDWLAVINDLHKGRHTGAVWSWVIDLSALLMILFALTGLVILFQNRRQRGIATWLLIAGSVTPLIIYIAGVPRVG